MNFKEYEKRIPLNFKSDGCTLAPDGTWGSCCIIHDHAKRNPEVSSAEADKMLYLCMKERANISLAVFYFLGVRAQSITKLSPITLAMLVVFFGTVFYFGTR